MKKDPAAEDSRLAALIKSDPQQGLAEAIRLWGGAARTLCRGQLRGLPEEEIEECVADCFAALWRDIGRWQPERGPLKGWFYGLCRHLAVDRRRAAARSCSLPLEQDLPDDDALEDQVAARLSAAAVQQAVDALDEPARTVFLRRYYACQTVPEIARTLSLSQKRVENLLFRTKPKLKELLLKGGLVP